MYLTLVIWEREGPGRPRHVLEKKPASCPPVGLTPSWPRPGSTVRHPKADGGLLATESKEPFSLVVPSRATQRNYANGLLGYGDDARLLIVNADDLGMSMSVNEAVLHAAKKGVVRSTSLMVPWPEAAAAMRMLRDNPEIHFGIHLSVICDMPGYRWGPVAPRDEVPSLIDESGRFYGLDRRADFLRGAQLDELEVEFTAQIDTVVNAELRPTHLDWHCLANGGRADIFELTLRLAKERGLALRVHGGPWIDTLRGQGLPTDDHDPVDSYALDPVGKSERYVKMLRDLPVGLSEWMVHPALDGPELRVMEPASWQVRHTDYEFLISAAARDTIEDEGIVLLSYEPLREVWAANRGSGARQ
jgi:chitin disaccharide deacetylase